MSTGWGRGVASRHAGKATAKSATTPRLSFSRRSLAIGHSPDAATRVVRDEQRTIGKYEQSYHPPPARAVRELPARREILARHRLSVLDMDPDDFVAGRRGAIPGAVERGEGIPLVVGRELRSPIESQAEGRRVGLEGDGRRLDGVALGVRILGVVLAGEIALGPAVPLPVLDDVQMLGGQVVAKVVPVVVGAPELAGRRVEGETDRVPQSRREHASMFAVEVVDAHRRAPRVRFVADVARGPGGHVDVVTLDQHGPGHVIAATRQVDQLRLLAVRTDPEQRVLVSYVQRVAAPGEAEGLVQARRIIDGLSVLEAHHPAIAGNRRVDLVVWSEGHVADAAQAVRVQGDVETGGNRERVPGHRNGVLKHQQGESGDHGLAPAVTVEVRRNAPSGSICIAVGTHGTSKRSEAGGPSMSTVRRTVLPSGPVNSMGTLSMRNRPQALSCVCWRSRTA